VAWLACCCCSATLRLNQTEFEQGSFISMAGVSTSTQLHEQVFVQPLTVTVAHHPQLVVLSSTSWCKVDIGESLVSAVSLDQAK
jgi:hypothetical protein